MLGHFRPKVSTILNAKLSQQRFWHCCENMFIKTISMIPQLLIYEFQVRIPSLWTSLICLEEHFLMAVTFFGIHNILESCAKQFPTSALLWNLDNNEGIQSGKRSIRIHKNSS